MKSTGIVRKIDGLGRIVIPKEVRRIRGIDIGAEVEMFVEKDSIVLRKYDPNSICMITDEIATVQLCNGNIVLSKQGLKILCQSIEELVNNKK